MIVSPLVKITYIGTSRIADSFFAGDV